MRKTLPGPTIRTPKRATPPERVPLRIAHPTLDDHLAVITRAIFQAGLSWAFIDGRWPAFIEAFEGFNVARVADYGECEIDRLMGTDGIVHSRKKIAGTIANAKALIALDHQYGGVTEYISQFPSYPALLDDARKRFAFLGDLSCYYWLFRTGHRVPPFETWIAGQPKDHPRMREMVLAGRSAGTSTEEIVA